MKRLLIGFIFATLLAIPQFAYAEIDLINIISRFYRVESGREYGFDFYNLDKDSSWVAEVRGVYGHTLVDTATGWAFSAMGITVGSKISATTDVSGLVSGTVYPVSSASGAISLVFDAAPTSGDYMVFVIVDNTNPITIDVADATGLGTDFSWWGANKVISGGLGKVFRIQAVTDGTDVKWGINDPTNYNTTGSVRVLSDSSSVSVGAGDDLSIGHDGTDSTILNSTGDLILNNDDDDELVVVLLGDDTADESFQVQNNSLDIKFSVDGLGAVRVPNDSITLSVGASDDLYLMHDGSDSYIASDTGDLILQTRDAPVTTAAELIDIDPGNGGNGDGLGTPGGAGGAIAVAGGTGGAGDAAGGSGAGGAVSVIGGIGGIADSFAVGGTGGAVDVDAGTGGAGSATQHGGPGGALTIDAGAGGADGGSGSAGANGAITIGGSVAVSIGLGNATDNTTITQTGTGQVTFAGNVDANAGLDVAADTEFNLGVDTDTMSGSDNFGDATGVVLVNNAAANVDITFDAAGTAGEVVFLIITSSTDTGAGGYTVTLNTGANTYFGNIVIGGPGVNKAGLAIPVISDGTKWAALMF